MYYLQITLDNSHEMPPEWAKKQWADAREARGAIDDLEVVPRRKTRSATLTPEDEVIVHHMETQDYFPKWTSPIVFTIDSKNDRILTPKRLYEIATTISERICGEFCINVCARVIV